jgi:hypothetical protein
MHLEQTINELLKNPKILQISHLADDEGYQYIAVDYLDRYHQAHNILIDPRWMHLLLNPFSITKPRDLPYIYLHLPTGKRYLHAVISGVKRGDGLVTHHIQDTLDVRERAMMICPVGAHTSFHLRQRAAKKSTKKEQI